MKKLLITTAILVSTATASLAQEYARITKIEPRYQTSYQNVPTTQCQNVEVPVYGTVQGQGATGGDVLAGMIIGGILGFAFGALKKTYDVVTRDSAEKIDVALLEEEVAIQQAEANKKAAKINFFIFIL